MLMWNVRYHLHIYTVDLVMLSKVMDQKLFSDPLRSLAHFHVPCCVSCELSRKKLVEKKLVKAVQTSFHPTCGQMRRVFPAMRNNVFVRLRVER